VVPNIQISATGLNPVHMASTTSGSGGTYTLTGLQPDTYQVTIQQLPATFWGFTGQALSYTVVLTAGQTFANLNFALTPKPTAQVQYLYQRVLTRSADAPGLSAWVTALGNDSLSLGQEFAGFVGSPEFQSNVVPLAEMLGAFFLNQPIDPNLLRYNIQLLNQGLTADAV
jgi:hypothetical protein